MPRRRQPRNIAEPPVAMRDGGGVIDFRCDDRRSMPVAPAPPVHQCSVRPDQACDRERIVAAGLSPGLTRRAERDWCLDISRRRGPACRSGGLPGQSVTSEGPGLFLSRPLSGGNAPNHRRINSHTELIRPRPDQGSRCLASGQPSYFSYTARRASARRLQIAALVQNSTGCHRKIMRKRHQWPNVQQD
jgi:hypothetical protein